MMTKSTSQKIAVLKKIAIVPILAGLIYFICIEVVAQEKTSTTNKDGVHAVVINTEELNNSPTDDKLRDAYYANVRIILNDCSRMIKINKMYEELTLEEKRRYLNFVPKAIQRKSLTEKELLDFKNSKKYAIWIDNIHVSNEKLNNIKPYEIAYFTGSSVLKNARSKKFPQPFQYSLYTRNYFFDKLKNSHLKFENDTLKLDVIKYDDAVKKN